MYIHIKLRTKEGTKHYLFAKLNSHEKFKFVKKKLLEKPAEKESRFSFKPDTFI